MSVFYSFFLEIIIQVTKALLGFENAIGLEIFAKTVGVWPKVTLGSDLWRL